MFVEHNKRKENKMKEYGALTNQLRRSGDPYLLPLRKLNGTALGYETQPNIM